MKNRAAPPVGRFRGGLGRLLVVAVATIGAGCVSGGGVPRPVMTQAEIDLLLAEYVGIWALDESASSPQVTIPRPETRTETRVVRADQLDDLRREAEEGRDSWPFGRRPSSFCCAARNHWPFECKGRVWFPSPHPARASPCR